MRPEAELLHDRATVRQASGQEWLDHLAVQLGNAERAMVDLLDARGTLEQRIGPVLRPEEVGVGSIQADSPSPERRTALDARLSDLSHVLDALVHSMSTEAEQLRSIAQRVEV